MAPPVVRIRSGVWEAMVAHAVDEAPNECCGLLVGTEDVIDECVRTRNLEAGPTRYRVDPVDHFALIRRLRGSSRRIVGAYHSHPHSAAYPSPTDTAEAFDSGLFYLIVSLAESGRPVINAYRLASGNIEAVPIVRVP